MTRDLSDDEILATLGVAPVKKKNVSRSPKEARIISGFEDILKFFEEHSRLPQHGSGRDIFERLYAARLDALRKRRESVALLIDLDRHGWLDQSVRAQVKDELDDDAILATLGASAEVTEDDISTLRHVKPRAEVRAAEEIASRTPCKDFDKFKPLFDAIQVEIENGYRETRRFEQSADIGKGEFFVLNGQKVYIAHVGERYRNEYDRFDNRLRVIYDNGTESDLLLRSLQRALYKDEAGRRITNPIAGPLFSSVVAQDDTESGTIYVLRSQSDHSTVAKNRELIHKVGVTGGDVKTRIASAKTDATFLLAGVEIVATYQLFNINRVRLEKVIHRVLAPARLDLEIEDRFGNLVRPKEWFLVPVSIINEVVKKIQDGSIITVKYDPTTASLIPA